jgi:hypothetical protein
MPKTKIENLPPFDAQALIAKTRLGPLRVGETHALSVHVSGLERALAHKTDAIIAKASGHDVRLCLNEDMSALVITFPGELEHSVSFPLDWRADLIIEFLAKTLRERRGAVNFVGTPGAPTAADLKALAKASAKPARQVGPQGNLTLEDLGL